jgi:2-keto-3-deoxy-galactonokinase
MSETISPGQLVVLDPSDIRVFTFDWGTSNLPVGVTISTSTFTITVRKQNGLTALTKDNETIISGNRSTQLRLNATTATLGDKYIVANKIVTSESPAQTKERSFNVLIEDR